MVFLGIVSLLMAIFFGYHAKLCLTNTTTNEWQDYVSLQRKITEAKASAAALKTSISALIHESRPPESKWKSLFRRSPLEDAVVVKKSIYDKGIVHNLAEIIFPMSSRSTFLQAKAKSK